MRKIEKAYFENLYRQFGDTWRVKPNESLFDYGLGQSSATFTDTRFPREIFTLNAVPPRDIEAAVATCREMGVDENQMDGCVFDVAATDEPNFANAALSAVGDVVTRKIRDEIIDTVQDEIRDEIRDTIPIPKFPF